MLHDAPPMVGTEQSHASPDLTSQHIAANVHVRLQGAKTLFGAPWCSVQSSRLEIC